MMFRALLLESCATVAFDTYEIIPQCEFGDYSIFQSIGMGSSIVEILFKGNMNQINIKGL